MKADIYLCDFNDSFTFNILSELLKINKNLNIEVISANKISSFLKEIGLSKKKIILGPGPGHPNEYQDIVASLKIAYAQGHYFLGICLGHQILSQVLGFKIAHCYEPKHGHTEKYKIPKEIADVLKIKTEIEVQRYNSLAVKYDKNLADTLKFCFKKHDEILMMVTKQLISYQFHPESIGTKNRAQFFKKFLEM